VLIQVPPNLVCAPDSARSVEEGECSKDSQGGEEVYLNTGAMSDICRGEGNGTVKVVDLSSVCTVDPSNPSMGAADEKSILDVRSRSQAGGLGRNDFLISLLEAGASDLGGISPLDEVNPSYEFQKVDTLKAQLKIGDFDLVQRLPVHERHFSLMSDRVRKVIYNEYHDFYRKIA
jgi:hypothetical protein